MVIRSFRRGRPAAALLALCLAGCATTGDPRQGGLFGWSESQARTRQTSLQEAEAQARADASREQQRSEGLRDRQAALTTEHDRLREETDRLLAENDRLEVRLRELTSRRQLAARDARRLEDLLAENRAMRASLAAPGATPPPAAPTRVNDQNQRLHRELLILAQP